MNALLRYCPNSHSCIAFIEHCSLYSLQFESQQRSNGPCSSSYGRIRNRLSACLLFHCDGILLNWVETYREKYFFSTVWTDKRDIQLYPFPLLSFNTVSVSSPISHDPHWWVQRKHWCHNSSICLQSCEQLRVQETQIKTNLIIF